MTGEKSIKIDYFLILLKNTGNFFQHLKFKSNYYWYLFLKEIVLKITE